MSFLNFQDVSTSYPDRKTRTFVVLNAANGANLGRIQWFAPWRRFVFAPEGLTVFDAACLKEISAYLEALMRERRA